MTTIAPTFTIRTAAIADASEIETLVKELRHFHNKESSMVKAENIRKYGFGPNPLFKVELAEVDNKIVGFAMHRLNWLGIRCVLIHRLEDLYVREPYRNQGIGLALLKRVVKYGVDNDCPFLTFEVSKWNKKALDFYKKIGAAELEDVCIYRMEKDAMQAFIKV